MIFEHDGLDHVGMQKLMLDPAEDALLEELRLDRAIIRASPPVLIEAAPPKGIAINREAPATVTANGKAREKMPRPAGGVELNALEARALRLDGLPKDLRHDAKMLGGLAHPFALRVGPDARFSGPRVRHLARPIVDDHPRIEPILQHAVLALPVPGDRRRSPSLTPGRRDAVPIELAGNGSRALAGGIIREDAEHDGRLVGVNLAEAADEVSAGIDAIRLAIPIGEARGKAPLRDRAPLPALDPRAQILPKAGVEEAFDRACYVVDDAVEEREEPGAGEVEPLPNRVRVPLVTGEPVRGFREKLLRLPLLDHGERRGELRPGRFVYARGAADGIIGEDADDGPALPLSSSAAIGDLIGGRPAILKVRAVSGVDDRSHRTRPFSLGELHRAPPSPAQ